MSPDDLAKSPFRLFAMCFYALISFITLFLLFSLFFIGAGLGLGLGVGRHVKTGLPVVETGPYAYSEGDPDSPNWILTLPVRGVILGSSSREPGMGLYWDDVTYGYEVRKLLEDAASDEAVKGVCLLMRTPGGTIFGSLAIHEGIRAVRAAGKPVLAFVEGISASGGVMAMSGATAIYADHGSLVGSIGVMGPELTYFDRPISLDGGLMGGGVMTEGGIEQTLIHSGRGKDLGNPFRRPTPDEIAILQTGTDNEYTRFLQHVATNRKIDESLIREKMGAAIFDNQTAEAYGLIDGTLDRPAALRKLGELAGVGEDFQVVQPREERRGLWKELLMSGSAREESTEVLRSKVRNDLALAVKMPLAYYGNRRDFMAVHP